jgi:hypothetical protein
MINRTRLAGTKKMHASVKTTYVVSAHPEASQDFYSFEAIVPIHFAISGCTTETAVAREKASGRLRGPIIARM